MNMTTQYHRYKATCFSIYSKIVATGGYLPKTVQTTDDIISEYEEKLSSKVIERAVGVRSRHIAADTEADSDLLVKAAQNCLKQAQLAPDQLTRMLVTKYIGDHVLPMTAGLLQKKLKCDTAVHSYDIDGGINSFCYALEAANIYINSGDEYILIVSGGIHNRYADKYDPRVGFLFGDGAAAVLLSPSTTKKFLATYLVTDHTYYHMAISHLGQSKPDNAEYVYNKNNFAIYTLENWKKAQDFYIAVSKRIIDELLAQSDLGIDAIDHVLITENNAQMVHTICKSIGIDDNKRVSTLSDTGNLMSAMLPMQLFKGFEEKRFKVGHKILLLSLGEGFNGGGFIYQI